MVIIWVQTFQWHVTFLLNGGLIAGTLRLELLCRVSLQQINLCPWLPLFPLFLLYVFVHTAACRSESWWDSSLQYYGNIQMIKNTWLGIIHWDLGGENFLPAQHNVAVFLSCHVYSGSSIFIKMLIPSLPILFFFLFYRLLKFLILYDSQFLRDSALSRQCGLC